jgi:hypothetical protein
VSLRLPDSVVAAMHAEYEAGASLSEVARRHGRVAGTVRGLFELRGLEIRPSNVSERQFGRNGCFLPYPPHTRAEIRKIILEATQICIPKELKVEWRSWDLKKRAWFIRELRKRLPCRANRPEGPFSANVEPFDYGSARAWEIIDRLNHGLPSWKWKVKMNLTSQGVIYKDRLWFWGHKFGYVSGPWSKDGGRPALHHVLWEEHTGAAVPTGHVIRFVDGNQNNLTVKNMRLETRNDLVRQTQAKSLTKKSRELTQLLIDQTRKGTRHERINIVNTLRRRHRQGV